jgi:hypothetical protein
MEFSVQENIDCAYAKKRNGCEGGAEGKAYTYAKENGAVPASDETYVGKYDS